MTCFRWGEEPAASIKDFKLYVTGSQYMFEHPTVSKVTWETNEGKRRDRPATQRRCMKRGLSVLQGPDLFGRFAPRSPRRVGLSGCSISLERSWQSGSIPSSDSEVVG